MFLIKKLINLIFPSLCSSCGRVLVSAENTICTKCRHNIPLTYQKILNKNDLHKVFYGRLKLKHGLTLMHYQKNGVSKNIIHNIKYKNKPKLGIMLAELLEEELQQINIDAVIPVPLHITRKIIRGYNQLDYFGGKIAKICNTKYDTSVLKRVRGNSTQTKKNRIDRQVNVANLFELKNSANYVNKHLLLIDDVLTTGATLEACCNELYKIEGVEVSIITMASVK